MMVNVEGKEYELIDFKSKMTNQTVTMTGYAFAKSYLSVSGSDQDYRVYNTISGEPLLRGRFLKLSTALKLAGILEDKYQDWFEIWDSYPQADIISWCKYSVDEGAEIFETIQLLDKLDVITAEDISSAWKQAKEIAKRWRA